jgi:hypothetical protein
VGFTWQAKWQNSTTKNKASLEEVKNAYNANLNDEDKGFIRNYENSNKVIPYDLIREQVKRHGFTTQFRDELTTVNNNPVYFVTGDPDAVSLKAAPPPSVEEVTQDLDALTVEAAPRKQQGDQAESSNKGKGKQKEGDKEVPVQQMGKALFERYDKIINIHRNKNGVLPIIVSGGYEFRMKGLGGQTGDALRAAANKLDMAVRQAMANINPNTVYFPEPNTIFKMEAQGKEALAGTFSSNQKGKSEGQNLFRSMRNKLAIEQKDLVFDREAAIETNSDRFTAIIDKKVVELKIDWTGGEIKQLTAKHIRALFESSQSHIKKLYWTRRMMPQYPGGEAYNEPKKLKQVFPGRGKAISNVYDHYFPHVLIGYKPELLKQKLNTYTKEANYGNVSEATKENLNLTDDYDSVISVAKEAGEAAKIFLKEILGI